MAVSSASNFPPLIATVEASVPVSFSFIDPADTSTPPERVTPCAIEIGVILDIESEVTVEFASTSRPELSADVLTLPTVIEFSRSLLLEWFNTKALVLVSVPPPLIVRVFDPRLRDAPE